MTVAEQVYEQAKLVPDALAQEALDFVLFLRARQERGEWITRRTRPGTIFGVAATLTSALDSDSSDVLPLDVHTDHEATLGLAFSGVRQFRQHFSNHLSAALQRKALNADVSKNARRTRR